MKATACPRLFEVEALRDGRLAGEERTDFERHLTNCRACMREARALVRLGEELCASSAAAADELHLRRERTRLLAAFDRSLLAGRTPPNLHHRRWALGAIGALVAAAAFATWRAQQTSGGASPKSTVVAAAEAGTVWYRRTEAQRDLVFLEQGALRIQVSPSNDTVPLLVVLPDGELEDIGTTFSVTVDSGRTTHVGVEEGSVLLRLRGRAPLPIGAGQQWRAVPEPPASASAAVAPPASSEPVEAPAVRAPEPDASALERRHEASDDFRDAMAALNAGRSAEAAVKFGKFVERYPRDPRTQDATYMRILALRAAGDSAAMRAAAAEYLRAYPKGFRRAEVEELAR